MLRRFFYLALLVSPCFWSIANADDNAICRIISDDVQRLNCFDKLYPPLRSPLITEPLNAKAVKNSSSTPRLADLSALGSDETLYISGAFKGWSPGSKVSLTNGLEVTFSDGTTATYDLKDPAVRLERGILGGWFLRIDGISQVPRVSIQAGSKVK